MNDNTEDKNGARPSPQLQQNPLSPEQAKAMVLEQFCWPACCVMVNGARLALVAPGRFDIGSVLVKVAGMTGRALGYTLSMGSLGDILQMRKACIDEFCKELRGVKIEPPPPLPGEGVIRPQRH